MAFRRSRVRSPSAPPTSAFPQFVSGHSVERVEVTKSGLFHVGREILARRGSSRERPSERGCLAPDLPCVRARRWRDECSLCKLSVSGGRIQRGELVESGSEFVTAGLWRHRFTVARVVWGQTGVVMMTVLL